MTLRKTGTCAKCSKPLYGDNYGAAGHRCEQMTDTEKIIRRRCQRCFSRETIDEINPLCQLCEDSDKAKEAFVRIQSGVPSHKADTEVLQKLKERWLRAIESHNFTHLRNAEIKAWYQCISDVLRKIKEFENGSWIKKDSGND